MFSTAHDVEARQVVCLFSGPTNDDYDFERYLESLLELDARFDATDQHISAILQIVDAENPPPNPFWRKAIATQTKSIRNTNTVFALVSTSMIIRGVITALGWIRPAPVTVQTFATVPEALAWMAGLGVQVERFTPLIASARAQANR